MGTGGPGEATGSGRDDIIEVETTAVAGSDDGRARAPVSAIGLAGLASMGAGAIHAAAVGIHAEHPSLSRIFVAIAAAQLITGLVTLVRPSRGVVGLAILVNGVAVVGWTMTRVSGISWIGGLEVAEDPQFADTVCAGLGALAVVAAGAALLLGRTRPATTRLGVPAGVVGALTVAAMMYGATHVHSDHAGTAEAAAGHDHGVAVAAAPVVAGATPAEARAEPATGVHTDDGHTDGHTDDHTGDHTPPTVAAGPSTTAAETEAVTADPRPYDPTKPIDLSGVAGVTLEQQAFAENLVARTIVDLPQWSDPAVAEAAGFRSIGDAATGHEHYIQWDWIEDDVWLDPDHPESLVFAPGPDGTKQLVSAMYMLPTMMPLDQVPDWGGRLMQWHVHDNLCFTDDPVAPLVRGLTNADGTCTPPLVKLAQSPMIHVWITPNECGPFAALEGLGAGSPPEGEETWCDTAHGGH